MLPPPINQDLETILSCRKKPFPLLGCSLSTTGFIMVIWQSAASSAAQRCRKLRGDRRSAALRGITSFAVRNIQTRSGLITRSCSGRLSPIACFGAIEVSKCFHVHTVSAKRERCKWKSLNGAENGAAKGYTSRVIVESRAATQPLSSSSKTPTTCCRTPLSGGGSSCSLAGWTAPWLRWPGDTKLMDVKLLMVIFCFFVITWDGNSYVCRIGEV